MCKFVKRISKPKAPRSQTVRLPSESTMAKLQALDRSLSSRIAESEKARAQSFPFIDTFTITTKASFFLTFISFFVILLTVARGVGFTRLDYLSFHFEYVCLNTASVSFALASLDHWMSNFLIVEIFNN